MQSDPVSWPELQQRTTWEATYTWHVAQNPSWRVYYGHKQYGPVVMRAVLVVDDEDEILYQHRQTPFDVIAEWLSK
jgi:hypothetical protein